MKKTIKKSDVSAFCFRERKRLFSATEKGKVSSPLQRKEGLFSATEKGKGSSLLPRKERALLRYRERKRHFSALQRKEAALIRFRERKRSFSSFEKGSGAFPLQRKQHFSVSFYRKEEYFSKKFAQWQNTVYCMIIFLRSLLFPVSFPCTTSILNLATL